MKGMVDWRQQARKLKKNMKQVSSAIIYVLGLIGLSVVVVLIALDDVSTVYAITDFASNIAGLVVAIAAVYGISTWKKQIEHQKKFNAVWECRRSIRRFHRDYINWRVEVMGNIDGVTWEVLCGSLSALERDLDEVDQFDPAGEWYWAGEGTIISMNMYHLHSLDKLPEGDERSEARTSCDKKIVEQLKFLNEKLFALHI